METPDDVEKSVMPGPLTRPLSARNPDGSWNIPAGDGPPIQPAPAAAPPATPVDIEERREYPERAISAPASREPQSGPILPDDDPPASPAAAGGPILPDDTGKLQDIHDEVRDLDPDQAAKIYEMSRQFGESPAFVQHNLSELQKAVKHARGPELDQVEKHYPASARFLSKPENMAVSRDDLESLRHHENIFSDFGYLSKMMRSFRSTGASLLAGLYRSGPYLHGLANLADNMAAKQAGRPQIAPPEWLKNSDAAEYYDRIAKEYSVPESAEEILGAPEKKAAENLGSFLDKVLALGAYTPGQFLPGLPGETKPAPRPTAEDLKRDLAPVIEAAKNVDYGRAISLLGLKVAQSAPSTAITLAATMASAGAGGPLGLGAIGLSTASGAYKEAKEKGLDETAATQRGTIHGISEAASEAIELGIMKEWADVLRPAIGKLATRDILVGVAKTISHAAAGEGFSEFWNSLVQSYADYSTRYDTELTPSRAFWRAVDAGIVGAASGAAMTTPAAVALAAAGGSKPEQTAIPTIAENQADDIRRKMEEGGVPEGAGPALDRSAEKPPRDNAPAWLRIAMAKERMETDGHEQDAAMASDLYNRVGELAGKSKTRQRSKEAHRAAVHEMAEANGAGTLYLPVEAVTRVFEARGESPVAAMQALGFGQAYEQAVDTGTAVQVPFAQWIEKTLDSDVYKAFQKDAKFDAGSLTVNEVKERREDEKAAREALEKAAAEAEKPEAQAVPSASTPEVRESADAVQAAFQNTMAQATGLTPEQVKSVYPLVTESEGEPGGGPTFNQPALVGEPKWNEPQRINLDPEGEITLAEAGELLSSLEDYFPEEYARLRKKLLRDFTARDGEVYEEGLEKAILDEARKDPAIQAKLAEKTEEMLANPEHFAIERVTEQTTGWSLEGSDERGWYNRQLNRTFKAPLAQAKEQLLAAMKARGSSPGVMTFAQSGLPAVTPTVSPLGFYSAVETEVLKMNFKSMPAQQFASTLKNIQGLKAEELDWMGLMDWLQGIEKSKGEKSYTVFDATTGVALSIPSPTRHFAEGQLQYWKESPAHQGHDLQLREQVADGKVSKDQVLDFIRANGIQLVQTVRAKGFRGARDSETLPTVSELEWDEGDVMEPDSDQISLEVEYLTEDLDQIENYFDPDKESYNEEATQLIEDDFGGLFPAENIVRDEEEKIDVEKTLEKLSKEQRKSFDEKLLEELSETFSNEAWDRARESLMESEYAEVRYTESHTGWTLEGNNEGGYYNSETEKRFEVSLEEAKIRLVRYMIEEGVVEGDVSELSKEADVRWANRQFDLPGTHYVLKSPTGEVVDDGRDRARLEAELAEKPPGYTITEETRPQGVYVSSRIENEAKELAQKERDRLVAKAKSDFSFFYNDAEKSEEEKAKEIEKDIVSVAEEEVREKYQVTNHPDVIVTEKLKHPFVKGTLKGNDVSGYTFTFKKRGSAEIHLQLQAKNIVDAQVEAVDTLRRHGAFPGDQPKKQLTPEGESGEFDPNAPTGPTLHAMPGRVVDGGTNHREIQLRIPSINFVQAGHFPESGIIVFFRLSDRIGENGERILAVEEEQSDIHQQGRKYGYKKRDGLTDEDRKRLYDALEAAGVKTFTGFGDRALVSSVEALPHEFSDPVQDIINGYRSSVDAVPDAPFKATEAWAALGMKRIIHLAVQEGYDAVAWFPAAVHVDRWGTDELTWVKKEAPKLELTHDAELKRWTVIPAGQASAKPYAGSESIFEYGSVRGDGGRPWETAEQAREAAEQYIRNHAEKPYFLVGSTGQRGGNVDGLNLEEAARQRGLLLERRGERVTTKEELRSAVRGTLTYDTDKELDELTEGIWKRMQSEISGTKAPRKEGMEFFYDNVLPRKVVPGILKKLDKSAKVTVGEVKLPDGEKQSVWKVLLTDKLKEEAKKGMTLFQPQAPGTGPRGQIQIGNEKALLRFLQTADPSTWVHELGHYYLESVARFVERGHASEKLTGYLTTVQAWWTEKAEHILEVLEERAKKAEGEEKVRLDAMLTTIRERGGAEYIRSVAQNWRGQVGEVGQFVVEELHEYHARGLEAFLMEGKAPSPALRSAFQRFREWLFHIYKELTALNVELTPEVRQAFARLLATEEEIKAAESMQAMEPLIADPAAAGMSEAEARRYNAATAEAQGASRSELNAQLAAQERKKQRAAYQRRRDEVEREVRAEVAARPEQLALAVLGRGTMPDGSPIPESQTGGFGPGNLRAVKLDRAAIAEEWGEEKLKELPRPYVYAKAGGVHPDVAAEMLGFRSGDELLAYLTTARPFEDVVREETDARMKAEHGDMLTDGTLPVEAMKAAHTEKRAKLLQMELEFLVSKRPGAFRGLLRSVAGRPRSTQAFRQQAESLIETKVIRDINPALYQRAEAKAAKEAVTLFGRGDIEGAIRSKERQLLNFHLYRAAVNAREKIDSVVEYMGRFTKDATRRRIGLASQEYLAQIDALIERFDFRRVSGPALEKRLSFRDWIEEQRALGFDPVIPEKLINEAYRTHYKEMEFGELVELRDTVKNIARLASLKTKLLKAAEKRELERAVDDAVSSIEAHSKGARPREIETRIPGREWLRLGAGFLASHRKFASLIRQMDGFEDGGVLWDLLVRPMNDAGNSEASMREDAAKKLHDIFAVYGVKDIAAMYRKTFIPEADISLTRMGMLMVALNWGNLDNRAKLMAGYGWTEAQVQAILDRLDERDWKVVQAVWDFVDSYWPESKALSERVTGVAPEKVEASAVQTKYGEFRGGYFPLKYDDRQSPRAYAHLAQEQAERAMHGGAVRSTTKHGHREGRVSGVERPVRLDFGVLFEHVTEVIHDQTHYEFLIDANRILGHGRIQEAILSHYGDIVYGQLRDALMDVAAGDVGAQTAFEKVINHVRKGSSIAAMGWSVMTTLQQPLGITQSMVRIGPKWVAKGLGRWLGDASRMESTAAWIYERSDFMRLRAKTQMREISEIRNQLRLKGQVMGAVEDSYFWLISRGQLLVDIPTWIGAYEKAAEETEDEARRVALADQAVLDSQGGGQVKDLAQIQRGGPLLKLWTNFYSFFNTTYNLTSESFGRTDFRDAHSVGRLAVDMLLLYSAPAILGMALKEALRGGDDDRRKSLAAKLVREQAAYLTSTMVGLREMSGFIQGFQNYEGPAGARGFAAIGKLAKQVQQGEADEAFWRSLNQAAGIFFHYPALQLERFVRGIIALEKGKTQNPLAPLVGPPKK